MSTPQPKPGPEKKPPVDAALREEIKKRARGVVDTAKAWLPAKSGDDRSAEELAKAMSPLEAQQGTDAVAAALAEIEQWVERRFDAHVATVAKDRGVGKVDLLGDDAVDAKGWLKDALVADLEPVDAAFAARKQAAAALASLAATPDDEAALAAPRRAFAEAGEQLASRLGALEAAVGERVAARWTVRFEKLANEGEERALAAVRDRAERAALRRTGPKKDAGDGDGRDDADARDGKGGGRRWYHWVLDAALLGAAAYLVYTRFIAKPPQQPAEAPAAAPSSSGSSSARAALSGVPIGATEVRAGPGMLYAPVETLAAPSRVQLLEGPTAGWVKVKTASSKEGWIPVGAIGPAPAPSASATSH